MFFQHQLSDEDDDYSSNKNSKDFTDFEKLINQYKNKRLFYGVETLLQFKQDPYFGTYNIKNMNKSKFYCKICLAGFEEAECISHCSSYIHLFRYAKYKFPIEYDRIVEPNNIDKSLEFVIKLLTERKNRDPIPFQIPEIVKVKDLERNFSEFLRSFPLSNQIVRLDQINLKLLNEKNENEDESEIDRVRKENITNSNKSNQSNFMKHLIDSYSEDFLNNSDQSSELSGRFKNYKTQIVSRNRFTENNSICIKEEHCDVETETNLENVNGQVEAMELNVEKIKDKLINIIENNDREISDEFVNLLYDKLDDLSETIDMNYVRLGIQIIKDHFESIKNQKQVCDALKKERI